MMHKPPPCSDTRQRPLATPPMLYRKVAAPDTDIAAGADV
jgi:hypothetical protein